MTPPTNPKAQAEAYVIHSDECEVMDTYDAHISTWLAGHAAGLAETKRDWAEAEARLHDKFAAALVERDSLRAQLAEYEARMQALITFIECLYADGPESFDQAQYRAVTTAGRETLARFGKGK